MGEQLGFFGGQNEFCQSLQEVSETDEDEDIQTGRQPGRQEFVEEIIAVDKRPVEQVNFKGIETEQIEKSEFKRQEHKGGNYNHHHQDTFVLFRPLAMTDRGVQSEVIEEGE